MKKLLTILTFLLVIGCNSVTDTEEPEPEFEPFEIGSFEITSEESAEWIGNQTTLKANNLLEPVANDTVQVTDSSQHNMTIFTSDSLQSEPNELINFRIKFTISELSIDEIYHSNIWPDMDLWDYPALDKNGVYSSNHNFEIKMTYYCEESTAPHQDVVLYFYNRETEERIKSYQFQSEGFEETVRHIVGC